MENTSIIKFKQVVKMKRFIAIFVLGIMMYPAFSQGDGISNNKALTKMFRT